MSQCADTADADADKDVAVVLELLCFSCPPTIVDEHCKVNVIVGVLIWKKTEEMCSLSLVDTVILDANGFQQQLLKYRGIQYAYFLGVWKQENCLHSCNFSHVKYFQMSENLILLPLLFSNPLKTKKKYWWNKMFL
jgi:hypothetical protein